MTKALIGYLVLTVFCPFQSIAAQTMEVHPADAYYARGNEAFINGDYSTALGHYMKSEENGARDEDLFLNAGIAAFRTGDLGRAVIYLNRALRLSPRDQNIRGNLDIVLSMKKDVDAPAGEGIMDKVIDYIWSLVSLNELMWIFSVFTLVFLCLAGLYPWLSEGTSGRVAAVLAVLSVAGALMVSPLLFARYQREVLWTRAVIVADSVEARSGPGEDFSAVFTVNSGTSGWIRNSMKGWSQITLDNGYSGWIHDSVSEKI